MNLSFEDICWIEAIAQRAIVNFERHDIGWTIKYNSTLDYDTTYARALSEVEWFYRKQLYEWGWIEREVEQQLRTKRLEYEAETARIRRFIEQEWQKKQQEIYQLRALNKRNREREDSWYIVRNCNAQQRKKLGLKDANVEVFQCMFDMAGGRSRWVFQEWLKGRTHRAIAININRSNERVRGIVAREIRRSIRPPVSYRSPRGRVVDMGGPRDVWLTYYPSSDPRLDNMEPVL